MEKASRSLEITVISAEGLLLNNRLIKKNTFVTVRADPNNYASTKPNTEDGGNPLWNEKLNLGLPSWARCITVEVQCKNSSGVKKIVGTAEIPVSDFIGDYTPAFYLHFLSYRLRGRDGERNGIINLSVKLNVPEYIGGRQRLPLTGIQAGETVYGGVAIGIPVSCGYKM